MSEEEQSELFKKTFTNTLKKLAEEPEELFDNDKLRKKYNNLLREQIKLKQENKQLQSQLQQKENIIKEVKEYIEEELKSGRSKDNQWLMGCYDEDKKILQILDKENK